MIKTCITLKRNYKAVSAESFGNEIYMFPGVVLVPGKIEMVKSKWGLAFSAVVTVIASLLMSVSLCLSFGLTPSLNGRWVKGRVTGQMSGSES